MTQYKFTPFFWNQFAKKEHYYKSAVLQEELKFSGYFNFIKNVNLKNDFVLKTDLYVEAKNMNDNFFPHLKINNSVGMDISFEVVRMAKENFTQSLPHMKFVVADVRRLPFKDYSFSAVISDSTLDQIPRDDLPRAVLEIKRVKKNNGKLILSLNNIFNFPFACDSIFKNLFCGNLFISYYYNPHRINRLLVGLGYKIRHWDYIIRLDGLGYFLIKLSNRIKIISLLTKNWLSFISRIGNSSFLRKFICLQFIIFAEKLEAQD